MWLHVCVCVRALKNSRTVKPHMSCLDRCVFIATNISPCSAARKYFRTDTIKSFVNNQPANQIAYNRVQAPVE